MSAKEANAAPEKKKKESILDLTRLVNSELNNIDIIKYILKFIFCSFLDT